MGWGGRSSLRVARENAALGGRVAARDPLKSKKDNPYNSYRSDLHWVWANAYQKESEKLELGK